MRNLMTTLESILETHEEFLIVTQRKQVNKDGAWNFIANARTKSMIDFNIAKLLSVKTDNGFKPLLSLLL